MYLEDQIYVVCKKTIGSLNFLLILVFFYKVLVKSISITAPIYYDYADGDDDDEW